MRGQIYRKQHRATGEMMDESREYVCFPDHTGVNGGGGMHVAVVTTAAGHEVAPPVFRLVRQTCLTGGVHPNRGTTSVPRAEFNRLQKEWQKKRN